jgi:hypothetical protein
MGLVVNPIRDVEQIFNPQTQGEASIHLASPAQEDSSSVHGNYQD